MKELSEVQKKESMLTCSGASFTSRAGISLNIRSCSAAFAAANFGPLPRGRNPRVSRRLFAHRLCLFMVLSLTDNPDGRHRHLYIARHMYRLFESIPAMLVRQKIVKCRGEIFQRYICVSGLREMF